MDLYANTILKPDGLTFQKIEGHADQALLMQEIKQENTDSDVLGDAYEYLIEQFASGAGKKAGEFYTPQQVRSVLAQLVTVGKKQLKSVYDPTCGSSLLLLLLLLLRVAKEVKTVKANIQSRIPIVITVF